MKTNAYLKLAQGIRANRALRGYGPSKEAGDHVVNLYVEQSHDRACKQCGYLTCAPSCAPHPAQHAPSPARAFMEAYARADAARSATSGLNSVSRGTPTTIAVADVDRAAAEREEAEDCAFARTHCAPRWIFRAGDTLRHENGDLVVLAPHNFFNALYPYTSRWRLEHPAGWYGYESVSGDGMYANGKGCFVYLRGTSWVSSTPEDIHHCDTREEAFAACDPDRALAPARLSE